MKLRNLVLLFATLLLTQFAIAQTGVVKGNVFEMVNGSKQPVPFANVSLAGTTTGGTTDFDGNFSFNANPGNYKLVVSFTGFLSDTSNVQISEGEETSVSVEMSKNVQQLKTAVVVGKKNRESETALILERKNASQMQESMGAGALVSKGSSDVGDGATKISGISKASARGIYVRGLGDRYNNVYLNRMPLPSPDPNKKVIDLSLIPTSVVRNIDVFKTFAVDQFGDMSGASLDISTKDAPEEDYFKFSAGVNYNSNASFKDFKNSRNGDLDYLGLSGSGREAPGLVRNELGALQLPAEANQDPFPTGMNTDEFTAPLDHSYSFQGGKNIELNEEDKVGIIASLSYRNSYRQDEGINNVLSSDQSANKDFLRERYRFSTNLTGLVGAEYNKNDKHIFNLNYLFINNSQNNHITSHGNDDEQDDVNLRDIHNVRDRYLQQTMNNIQLRGSHEVSETWDANWGVSYSSAKTDEPDRRDYSYVTEKGDYDNGYFSASTGGVNQRYYQFTDENEIYAFGEGIYNLGIPFDEYADGGRHKIVFGIQTRFKNRDTEFKTFQYNVPTTSPLFTNLLDLNNLDAAFTDAAYSNGDYSYTIIYSGSSISKARRYIYSSYAYADLDITEKLKIVPGVRLEVTDQLIEFKREGVSFSAPFEEAEVDDIDLMPSLSAKYTLDDLNALRFAASKTLTRPNFQELVPIGFLNENLQSITGRPSLQNSEVYNFDLKFERINKKGELISLGGFYKYIDKPIEQVASGVNFISYFNMNSANVLGAELDFNVRLSTILGGTESQLLNGIYFDGNVTYMHTSVKTDDLDEETQRFLTNVTETERQLQGASPILLNGAVAFDKPMFKKSTKSNISISANYFGDRIFAAGTNGRGDEYELGFWTLNLVAQNTWENGFGVKVSARNLLDPDIQREQKAGPDATRGDALTQSFTRGMNFGLSLTYTFKAKSAE